MKTFARDLVLTGELDPMYDMMYRINPHEKKMRFVTHFFLFYDAGEAALCMNDPRPFWSYVMAGYSTFKRGTERRHFRGDNGLKAISILSLYNDLDEMWDSMYGSNLYTIAQKAQPGTQIGPYFQWKMMDIYDRVFDDRVFLSLDEAVKYLPDEPRKCAKAIWPDMSLRWVLQEVASWIDDIPAPGPHNRNCGYSEAETILCAINGFRKGSYKFGQDLERRHRELAPFPELRRLLPDPIVMKNYEHTLDTPAIPA